MSALFTQYLSLGTTLLFEGCSLSAYMSCFGLRQKVRCWQHLTCTLTAKQAFMLIKEKRCICKVTLTSLSYMSAGTSTQVLHEHSSHCSLYQYLVWKTRASQSILKAANIAQCCLVHSLTHLPYGAWYAVCIFTLTFICCLPTIRSEQLASHPTALIPASSAPVSHTIDQPMELRPHPASIQSRQHSITQ